MTIDRTFRRFAFAAAATLPLLANGQSAVLDAYPDQITFCAPPLAGAGPEAAVTRATSAPVTVDVTVANLATTRPLPIRRVKGVNKSFSSVRPYISGRVAGTTDFVYGAAPSIRQPDPDTVLVETVPQPNPRSAFRATTTCFDRLGSAVPLFGGNSCKVSITFTPSRIAVSETLQIVSDDPARPVINVPLLVSRAENCRQPAQRPFTASVTPGAFYPVAPGSVVPEIAKTTECSCNVACGFGGNLAAFPGMHVKCLASSLDNCDRCCYAFGNYLCGPGELNFFTGQAWN